MLCVRPAMANDVMRPVRYQSMTVARTPRWARSQAAKHTRSWPMFPGDASSTSASVMPYFAANSRNARCAVSYVAAVLS